MRTRCQNGEHDDTGDGEHTDTGGNTNGAGISDETYKTRMHKLYNKMDTNADGKLSLTEIVEFSSSVAKHMHALDKNEDGKLTLDEWFLVPPEWTEQLEKMRKEIVDYAENKSAAGELDEEFATINQTMHETMEDGFARIDKMKQETAEGFKQMDTNNDGMVDENELAHDERQSRDNHTNSLMSFDLDGDGKFDLKEFYQYELENGQSDEHVIAKLFDDLDVDGDGKLTRDDILRHWSGEYDVHAAFGPVFVNADTNKDSLLTWDEFHEHPKSDAVDKFLKEWTSDHMMQKEL